MKKQTAPRFHRIAALLAATAFVSTPAFAQDAQPAETTPPAAETPSVTATPPVTTTAPPPATVTTPVATPEPEAETAAEPEERPRTRAARTAAPRAAARPRSAIREPARTRPAPVQAAAPAPARAAEAPAAEAPAPEAAAPAADPAPAPIAAAPPAPAAEPVLSPEPAARQTDLRSYAPWLAGGVLLLLGALGLLAWRRRRARAAEHEEVYYDQPVVAADPVEAWPGATQAVEPERVHVHTDGPGSAHSDSFWPAANDASEPLHTTGGSLHEERSDIAPAGAAEPASFWRAANDAADPIGSEEPSAPAPGAEFAPAAGAAVPLVSSGHRPWIDFMMRPVRAGVGEDKAVVEFELTVGNSGSAPAGDVRISTWMFPAGSSESEMERMLIEPGESLLPPETIEAGDGRCIETSVALPRAVLHDAILPVVVADVRYRLPDGSEGRTSATFEVGVPLGEGLAHFDVDNPSGLHDHVEARLRGEPQKV